MSADRIDEIAEDWFVSLRTRVARSTLHQYRRNVALLTEWLTDNRQPLTPDKISKRVLNRYFADLSDRDSQRRPGQKVSPSYVSLQFRGLQQFWKYMHAEGDVTENVFLGIKPPKVPDIPVPIFTDEEIRNLLATCNDRSFDGRRDTAILRVLLDCGVRVSELVGMTTEDIDFTTQTFTVLGKGNRIRTVAFGNKTDEALRRYLRVRESVLKTPVKELWVGRQRGMTTWGIRQVTERRGKEAGVTPCNPHRFRHTSVHKTLSAGVGETSAMALYGWRSRSMLSRYAASAATERAVAAHHQAAIGDKF